MRLTESQIQTINTLSKEHFGNEIKIYLFGSRTDNNAKGGDIDLLLLSQKKVPKDKLRQFRINFYKKFGWQKIDLVNFTFEENTAFKQIALSNSILLE